MRNEYIYDMPMSAVIINRNYSLLHNRPTRSHIESPMTGPNVPRPWAILKRRMSVHVEYCNKNMPPLTVHVGTLAQYAQSVCILRMITEHKPS